MSTGFLWVVLLTRRKDFMLLNRQLHNGAYGNETYQNSRIVRVQHNNPGIPNRTGFVHHSENASTTMDVYPQLLETEPAGNRGRIATVVYSQHSRAERLVEYSATGVKSASLFTYVSYLRLHNPLLTTCSLIVFRKDAATL
jgi:hypothetical protein